MEIVVNISIGQQLRDILCQVCVRSGDIDVKKAWQ